MYLNFLLYNWYWVILLKTGSLPNDGRQTLCKWRRWVTSLTKDSFNPSFSERNSVYDRKGRLQTNEETGVHVRGKCDEVFETSYLLCQYFGSEDPGSLRRYRWIRGFYTRVRYNNRYKKTCRSLWFPKLSSTPRTSPNRFDSSSALRLFSSRFRDSIDSSSYLR